MKDSRFQEIHAFVRQNDSLSNDAFLAKLSEEGISEADLRAYTTERAKRERVMRDARRKA